MRSINKVRHETIFCSCWQCLTRTVQNEVPEIVFISFVLMSRYVSNVSHDVFLLLGLACLHNHRQYIIGSCIHYGHLSFFLFFFFQTPWYFLTIKFFCASVSLMKIDWVILRLFSYINFTNEFLWNLMMLFIDCILSPLFVNNHHIPYLFFIC